MRQIIVYDIPGDVLRNKVAHALQDYGFDRVQYSVFVGSRTQNILEMLAIELRGLVKKADADILFYQQCEKCITKTMVVSRIGDAPDDHEVMFPCPAQSA